MTESETAESKMAEYNLLFREIVDTILFGDNNFSRQTNLGKKKFWTNLLFRDNQFSKDKNYFRTKIILGTNIFEAIFILLQNKQFSQDKFSEQK